MSPTISILVITFNRPEDTLALLKSIEAQNKPDQYVGEILLLNNNSSDSYEKVEEFIQSQSNLPIQYIKHQENLGVARGRNFLIKKAVFPLLLILDDDTVFPENNAIEKLASYFNNPLFKENNTAVFSFEVFYFDTLKPQKSALPHKNYKEHKDKEDFLTYYFFGGAHIMKREIFEKTGLYPESFFYGMEEYDLSYRIIDAGYTLAYNGAVRILHKESPAGRVTNSMKLTMMWYNKCVVAWRYLPSKYFYSTAIMWALQYLKKTRFDFIGMLKNLNKIKSIPREIRSEKISKEALSYLKKVKARLWY